jgi:hypothetical protein
VPFRFEPSNPRTCCACNARLRMCCPPVVSIDDFGVCDGVGQVKCCAVSIYAIVSANLLRVRRMTTSVLTALPFRFEPSNPRTSCACNARLRMCCPPVVSIDGFGFCDGVGQVKCCVVSICAIVSTNLLRVRRATTDVLAAMPFRFTPSYPRTCCACNARLRMC